LFFFFFFYFFIYLTDNGAAVATAERNVNAGDTVFYFLGGTDISEVGNSGEYSLVISSNQAVNAVANSTSSGGGVSGTNSTTAFDGVSGDDAASKLFAPNIYSDYFNLPPISISKMLVPLLQPLILPSLTVMEPRLHHSQKRASLFLQVPLLKETN
jgi:hypothetical protein